jgi:hypothetical protein
VLGSGAQLVFGGHPLITPVVFTVAAEQLGDAERDRVVLFQSDFFADVLPTEVWNFRSAPWASVRDIGAKRAREDDSTYEFERKRSSALADMRDAMVSSLETPIGAVFIGGKTGIVDEYERVLGLAQRLERPVPCYPIGLPGGRAAELSPRYMHNGELESELRQSGAYHHLLRKVVADMIEAQEDLERPLDR